MCGIKRNAGFDTRLLYIIWMVQVILLSCLFYCFGKTDGDDRGDISGLGWMYMALVWYPQYDHRGNMYQISTLS